MEHPLVWVLLVPAVKAWIEKRIRELMGARNFDVSRLLSGWHIQECRGHYTAVLNRLPGSEQSHELFLAEKFSTELGEPVYVLYMDPEYANMKAIDVYEGGHMTGDVRGDPYTFARQKGCDLPEDS
jgi:hypothetical protein